MPIQITITANSAGEIVQLVQDIASVLPGMDPATIPPKTEVSTLDPEPEPKTGAQPQDETNQPTLFENIPDIVELRAKAQEKGKTPEGKKAIKALLEKYGCRSISTVPEEKRAEFLAELEAL